MAVTIKDLRLSIYLNNADAVKSAMQFQTQLQKVGDEMAQLSAQGKKDTPEYREKKKAFDDFTKSMEQNKLQAGLLGMSMKELGKLYRSLKSDRDRFVEGSNEWKALDKDLKVVGDRITDVKNKSSETGSSLSKLSTGFNKYFGIVASGVAIFAGLISKMDEYNEKNKQLEVSQKNLQSLTGLSDKDTGWVTKQAAKTSTGADKNGIRITQNSQEIIDAMTIVGSQRAELLKNKEALLSVTEDAMKMSIASKDTLEASTEALTNTMNQFNLEGSQSNRIINSLAAGSLVGAGTIPYLSQSIEKAGTTANLMGISVENTIGIIEGVAPKFKQAEVAGNSLDKVLMIMKEKQIGYASGVFNMNDALLELKQRYDKGETSVSIFGREHAKMGEVLVQAREKINEYTLGVTGTNVAIEQAAKNSDTYAAKEAQATNRINEAGMALAKNMNGIKLFTKEVFANLMESMSKIAGNTKSATEEFDDQSKKVVDLKMNIEPLLKRYDELASKANKSTTENAELKRIVGEVTSVMPGATTAVDKYGNAISISTGRVREWIGAEVARMGVVNRSAIEENKKSLTQIEKDILRSKQNIDEINKTGTYKVITQQITGQGAVINTPGNASAEEVKAEQEKYRQLIQDKLGYQSEIDRLNGATLKRQISDAKKSQEEQSKIDEAARLKAKADAKGGGAGTGKPDKNPYKKRLEELDRQLLQEQVLLKKANKSKEDTDKEMLELDVKYLTKKRDLYKKDSAEWLGFEDKLVDIERTKKTDANKANLMAIQDSYQAISDATTVYEQQKKEELQNSLDDGLITQDEYNAKIVALDVTLAEKRLQNAKNYQELISGATFNSEEDRKKAVEAANSAVTAANKVLLKANKAVTKNKLDEEKRHLDEVAKLRKELGLDREVLGYKAGLAALKANLKKVGATEKESADAIAKYKVGKVREYAETAQQLVSGISDFVSAKNEAETSKLEAEKNKQLAAAGDNADKREAIEKDFAKRELELKKKQAKANLLISIAQATATGALGIANIWAKEGVNPILAGILTAVLVGVTAAQIGAAKAQNDAIQSTQLWTGGYTGDGGEREPAGVVHKGEFVANAKAVRNPQVKKFLDVFNAAQLNGSIHMLNTTQILEKVRSQPAGGYQAGGYVQNGNGAVGSVNSDVSMAIISENARQMERLNAHLDKGILSYSVISGDAGSVKQTERYVKMKANASR